MRDEKAAGPRVSRSVEEQAGKAAHGQPTAGGQDQMAASDGTGAATGHADETRNTSCFGTTRPSEMVKTSTARVEVKQTLNPV